jgi:hypothetical protein
MMKREEKATVHEVERAGGGSVYGNACTVGRRDATLELRNGKM